MKNLFLFCLLIPGLAIAQATTEAEYDYVVLGYKNGLRDGFNFKKDYSLRLIQSFIATWDEGKRIVEFHSLKRNGEKQPCAIMMIYKGNPPMYFCIPSPDASTSMWSMFDKSVEGYFEANGFNPATSTLIKCMSRMISNSVIDITRR